jgi:uncharacterized protein YchJ
MQEQTGEVKHLTPEEKQNIQDLPRGRRGVKVNGNWWIETKVEPTVKQLQSGVKGWHLCLCGSGKKFRECCRVKTPFVKRTL